jgi:AraC-like DNA-binding protein
MRSAERTVCPALRPWVDKLWAFEGEFEFALERVLPSGLTEVLINLAEDETRTYPNGPAGPARHAAAVAQGPRTAPVIIDTAEQRRVVGVVLRPGAARVLLGVPAAELVGEHVDLAVLWPDGAVLRESLLAATPEEWLAIVEDRLVARLDRAALPEPAILDAARALDAGATVSAVHARVGMGRKRFTRLFREAVGLTPKRFAGIRRFRRVLAEVQRGGTIDWAGLAAECGYFDQPHLIADFRRFAGFTPSRYQPRQDAPSHVRL